MIPIGFAARQEGGFASLRQMGGNLQNIRCRMSVLDVESVNFPSAKISHGQWRIVWC